MPHSPVPDRDLIHLRQSERVIFRLFESQSPLGNADYIFDLHLGEGITPKPHWPTYIVDMARSLTQRRVDVVASLPDQTWLLEIKDRSGTTAVGQLLTYKTLYELQFPTRPSPLLGIIARQDGFDLDLTYQQFNIRLFLV